MEEPIKMKNKQIKILMIATLVSLAVVACHAPQTVMYAFPASMGDEVKQEYIKQFDKGKILYDLTCAKCHTTIVKKKEVIRDFTEEQLVNYELRIQNQDHIANISTISEEELALILTFLRYKKPN